MRSTRKYKKSKNPKKLAHRSRTGSASGSIGEELSLILLHAASLKKKKRKKVLTEPKLTSWRCNRQQARPEDVQKPRFTF